MPIRRLSLLLAVAALLVPAAAHAAPVAVPGAPTAVSEYRGTIVFSQYDGATQTYTLMQRAPGRAPARVPGVEPADRQFDVDIGPDSAGKPAVVFARCDETCDLFIARLDGSGGGVRAIRNANDPDHNDTVPTLWRGRIAWARIYGEQRDRKVVVYTKKLTTPRSTPSTRLPGVPTRRCGDFEKVCGPTTGRTVEALELYRDDLAQIVDYTCRGCSGIAETEVRNVRVSDRSSSVVAYVTTGMSGQSWIGPSFHAGTLSFYRACLGEAGSCSGDYNSAFRYAVNGRQAYRGPAGPREVFGFADAGDVLYEVVGCAFDSDAPFDDDCRIEEVPVDASYERVKLPQRGY